MGIDFRTHSLSKHALHRHREWCGGGQWPRTGAAVSGPPGRLGGHHSSCGCRRPTTRTIPPPLDRPRSYFSVAASESIDPESVCVCVTDRRVTGSAAPPRAINTLRHTTSLCCRQPLSAQARRSRAPTLARSRRVRTHHVARLQNTGVA